jgi:iron(II)-dependent oxidoreductase
MSPLVWDLAHIAAYEDLWLVHRFAGEPLLHPSSPRATTPSRRRARCAARSSCSTPTARAYLATVRERTLAAIDARGVDPSCTRWSAPRAPAHRDDAPGDAPGRPAAAGEPAATSTATRRRWLDVPAGRRPGAPRRRSPTTTSARATRRARAFRIARRPVTNATWLHFTEGGGYQRREWWSDEGWAWKEDYDIGSCPDAEAGHPDAPVCHVSWFEADAFARSRGARLPTEAGVGEGGDLDPRGPPGHRAGLGVDRPPGSDGYPGFVAHPVSRVLEVFFGTQYRVLRGGSWATDPRVATPSFRNWDLPQRRQIFAGVRLATDPEES